MECVPGCGIYNFVSDHITTFGGIDKTAVIILITKCRTLMENFFGGTLSSEKHPTPYNDSKLYRNMTDDGKNEREVFYGFSTESQFRNWFYSDELLEQLNDVGVTLACYKVKKLYDGNTQATASIEERKPENILWRMSLKEYLERPDHGGPAYKGLRAT